MPEPLPDRFLLLAILATLVLVFAVVVATAKLQPAPSPLQWREAPAGRPAAGRPAAGLI
jgi:hypothetical protein